MTPPLPEESRPSSASAEVAGGRVPRSSREEIAAVGRSSRPAEPAAPVSGPGARPVVLGPGDEDDPGWTWARSAGEVEELVHAGHTVAVVPALLAGVPSGDGPDAEAAELTAASICAWLGARVFRTDRPGQVRLAVEMTESLAGRRPPALTRRGLA
ncbi:hypothetical protein [Streptosporangium sp. NPDC023615]|uniref:hypothetical protein n=1 Tax=Streptosporangium sp. NPDC023615 TaxID=3154794 RepID=UPI003444429F